MPRRSLSDRVTDSFRVLTELDLSHAYERQAGTIALGVLAVVALVVAVATGMLLGGDDRMEVAVELPAAGGLAGGDPVLIRGVPVGRVRHVTLVAPGRVRAELDIAAGQPPRRDATAEVVALDLIGNMALAYVPGTAPEPLPEGEPVVGHAPETVMQQLAGLREQAGAVAANLRSVDVGAFREDIGRTEAALRRARAALAALPADSVISGLEGLLDQADTLVRRFDDLRAAFPAEALAARRDTLAADAATLMANVGDVQASLQTVRGRTARAEGDVGRFLHDSALRVELAGVQAALRELQAKYLGRRAPPDSQ